MGASSRRAILGLLAAVGLFGMLAWSLRAQGPTPTSPGPNLSVQEALLQPFRFSYGEDTSLDEVANDLGSRLDAPVVLDLGALDRLGLTSADTVRLELDGVRLKTALEILLDQVGMTYRVIPEDNLLLLTDAWEADDRDAQILDELQALHRDVHDLQDLVDEWLGDEGEDWDRPDALMQVSGSRMRPVRSSSATRR